MINRKIYDKLNDIQNSVYISQCWLDIAKQYIDSLDNDLHNKVGLIIDILIANNQIIFSDIEDFWKNTYN